MALTIEDWKDRYYEQQALHTESNGMLCQERDRALVRKEELLEAMRTIACTYANFPDSTSAEELAQIAEKAIAKAEGK